MNNNDDHRNDYPWRYVSGGLSSHALPHPRARGAICGVYVAQAGGWHGASTPAEFETIATLPRCVLCLAIINENARIVSAPRTQP